MNIKQQINQDLKTAMLSGDKGRAMTLRGLKSVILDAEIAQGVRDTGLNDKDATAVLKKEAKKRQESADLYEQAQDNERMQKELSEKEVIDAYLPEELSEEAINTLIDGAIEAQGAVTPQTMGKIIGHVQQASNGAADGAKVAALVKGRLA